MKTLATLVSFFLLILAVSFTTNAQGMPDITESNSRDEKTWEQKHNERIQPKALPKQYPVTEEPRVLTKGLLAPALEDRLLHEDFLKQSKTGLIRLMPRENYDWEAYTTVPVQIKIRGGGSYFSFFHRTHAYGYGSDLGLERNKLRVGFAGASYGMIADLGDVPIESISDQDSRFVFMSNYEPRSIEEEARAEFVKLRAGLTVDGNAYRSSVPAKSQNTYMLRSIDFRTSDVLVAFRVTRIDGDGSAIIAWKLLKTFPTPQLKR
jgi:hypothetical protein